MQELIWQLLDLEMSSGEAFLFVERLNLIETCITELAKAGVGSGGKKGKTPSKDNVTNLSAYKKNLQTLRGN